MGAMGINYFLCRLPDSVAPDGRWKGAAEWAKECLETIKKFSAVGVRDYQVDNEPNLTWPKDKAWDWQWLTNEVISVIRQSVNIPKDVRLGLAPLAWKPDIWASVQTEWIPAQRSIFDKHQFVCVHSYWQYGKYFNDPSFGGNVTHWHDVLLGDTKPYVITEWGSSAHELEGITPKEVEQLRMVQYPAWLNWIRTKPYVESSFLFILNSTSDWLGFNPGDKVLKAI